MTDQPIREPIPADPQRDRADDAVDTDDAESSTRPSKAEGSEEDAGRRAPRPSQAEGERDDGAL
jgi:hypothetical protein